VGDFYYELGVQIIEVCIRTRSGNGGLIEMEELKRQLELTRGRAAQTITNDDIERAMKKLKVLGSGYNLLSVGSKKMIQSVPCELNIDHTTVLVLAQATSFVTSSILQKELKWTTGRIETVMFLLLQEGIAWVDDQATEREYWFVCLMNNISL